MFSFLKDIFTSSGIQTYNKKVRALFTLYTIVIMVGLSILIISFSAVFSINNGKNNLKANVGGFSQQVSTWMNQGINTTNTVADTIESSGIAEAKSLSTLLNSLSSSDSLKNVQSFYLAYGNEIISAKDKAYSGESSFTTSPWYLDALDANGSLVIGMPHFMDDSKYITMSRSLKIKDKTCVLAVDISLDSLDSIVKKGKVNNKVYYFIVDDYGFPISHPSSKVKLSSSNMQKITEILNGGYKKLKLGKNGYSGVKDYDGIRKLAYSYKLTGSNWTVVGVIPYSQINIWMYIVIILMILATAGNAIILNTIISDKISRWFLPLLSISNKVDCFADGDLSIRFDENIVSSEMQILANALNKTTENINIYISDIKHVLKSLSDGQLNIATQDCYTGDFNEIKESLDSIIDNLNNVFSEINETALGVSYNAEHMQASSQELAAGVTEQSEYIKEMFSSIEKLSRLINSTASNSVKASEMADKSASLLEAENEDMAQLLQSMDEIKETSKQIGAIINTINEIADQTDLLALNASIEASRAGEAGKSFAVIAGEVGSLAKDAAESVKTITELINNSTQAVNKGVEIANKTAELLLEAVVYSNNSKNMIDEISSAASAQSEEITKVNNHVTRISGVTENNQAGAEENFAISDEASNQANLLKSMVNKFDFKQ